MRYLFFLIIAFIVFAIFTISPAFSKELEMLDMWYSEDVTRVDVGETITWKPTVGGHNVHFVAWPEEYKMTQKPSGRIGQEYTITLTEPGIYVYLCTPHVRHGMISFIIVGDDISNKDQIAETLLFGKSQTKLDEFVESL
tara:strand:- start:142 stop:561 length:420 start_codon:yes stop_codon:yes gene_type:complete